MTSGRAPRVCIAGGGITGLVAAWELSRLRPDAHLTLLEARERLGGNIVTERRDGFVLDGGPDSFLRTKPEAAELCRELGLGDRLVAPREDARTVFLAHRGRLERLPAGMALAVPTRMGPMLRTPVLGMAAKLRAAAEPLVSSKADGDESIDAFISRRLGPEVAQRIAGPLLGGIFAGDCKKLSMRATFPQLVEMEAKHGSLVRALHAATHRESGGSLARWLLRGGEGQDAPPSPFLSLTTGMGTLIDTLAAKLPAGVVRCSEGITQVARVEGYERRWIVETRSGEPRVADAVVLAVPAHAAARAVRDAELGQELSRIPYVSTATVFLALDAARVEHALDGVGFIAPSSESRLLAATWVSSKWSGRAPEGSVLVRAFLGGARSPTLVRDSSDEELVSVATAELTRLMGSLGPIAFTAVFRWMDSGPQPVVGHSARLERIRARLVALPGLHLAGAAYDGVGIPDCVRQARAAARAVAEGLPA